MAQSFKNLGEAEKFLLQLASQTNAPKMGGEFGLVRTLKFLELLGNPQEKMRVIHVAGTSGKGSTSSLIAALLEAHSFRVGLHLSPHILDVRERVQVKGKLLEEEKFCGYLAELVPVMEELEKTELGMPTFFETLVVLAFYSFWKEGVEFAVMETGLGGLLDGTNTVSREDKICVLTRIGFDHTEILGKTFAEIAAQKTGIIQAKNLVVALAQDPEVNQVFTQAAAAKGAALEWVEPTKHFQFLGTSVENGTCFDFRWRKFVLPKLFLGLFGEFQVENAALALVTLVELAEQSHFKLQEAKIRETLQEFSLPARMQMIRMQSKRVMIDGAHNEQKMLAFISSLTQLFPQQKFAFLVAFKKGKDFQAMLRLIMPLASQIILTTFFTSNQDMPHLSENPAVVAEFLQQEGFSNFQIIEKTAEALQKSLRESPDLLVVTGSFYLVGEILKML